MKKTFEATTRAAHVILMAIESQLEAIERDPIDAKERCHKIGKYMKWLYVNKHKKLFNALADYWMILDWKYPDTAKQFLRAFEESRRILGNEFEAHMETLKDEAALNATDTKI